MKPEQYIRGFDGLRAIAVGLVLAAHSNTWEPWRGHGWFDQFVFPLVLGLNGVLLFFVLSGFLITLLLLRERRASGYVRVGYFLLRRALRLLPAFVLFFSVLLVLTLGGWYDIHPYSFAFAGLYLYNFIPKHFYSGYFGLTWSLGVEEQFYLLWPWLLGRRAERNDALPRVGGLAVGGIVLSLLFMAVVPDLLLPDLAVTEGGETIDLGAYTVGRVFFPYRWFIPMASYLLLGCVAAAWVDGRNQVPANVRWWPWAALLLLVFPWYNPGLGHFPQKLLQATGATLLLLWIYYRPAGWLTRLLELPPLRHLGRLSYGLYLYSGIFLATGIDEPEYWWQELPAALVLTYLLALFSHFTLERWFLGLKQRFTPPRSTPTPKPDVV